MKKELGIAKCGLACCLCSENNTCKGCHQDDCMDAYTCENRICCNQKNIDGCYMCDDSTCQKGLFKDKIKPRAFSEYIRRYSIEDLLNRLEINEQNGIIYHREGIIGDYDDFDNIESLIKFINTGKKL